MNNILNKEGPSRENTSDTKATSSKDNYVQSVCSSPSEEEPSSTTQIKKSQNKRTMTITEAEFITNDSIHGTVRLPSIVKKFIDHPLFQRLRHIRQLALCESVYIGATHTRLAHSIGTCYLAYSLLKKIRRHNSQRVKTKDIHCICLAALLHDLGHPCFSHMFESFMQSCSGHEHWEHEDASLKLCDAIFKDRKDVLEYYDIREVDQIFIKELISPPKKEMKSALEKGELQDKWSQLIKGRPLEDAWMYKKIDDHCVFVVFFYSLWRGTP